jgi:hypothetical protein
VFAPSKKVGVFNFGEHAISRRVCLGDSPGASGRDLVLTAALGVDSRTSASMSG